MKPLTLVASLVAIGAAVPLLAQSPMRAGQWEGTAQMDMPGMQMPAMKSTQCVTPDQLKDPLNALPTGPNPGACKASDYKADGSKVSWKMVCQGMSGTGELTFKGDTYDGTMKMSMGPQGEMAMKLTGKRTGDCTK
jgi:hypothetical protein